MPVERGSCPNFSEDGSFWCAIWGCKCNGVGPCIIETPAPTETPIQ